MKTPEQLAKYNRTYYLKNKEVILERCKQAYEQNKESVIKRTGIYARKRKYGLSEDDVLEKLKAQNFRCVICLTELLPNHRETHIDHNHKTGAVRDVLCSSCNKGLGHFKDSVNIILNAAEYLKKHENH